jgi:Protein of unknown function (DUF2378)
MDSALFPSATAYIASLPGGLSAHPQCLVKGSVVREFLATQFAAELRDSLPLVLRDYYEHRPVATSWVPEVHMHVFLHAAFDRIFAGPSRGGEAAFLHWVLESNRALLNSPLYRVLFFVVSTERLFMGFDKRWSAFRRGSSLHVRAMAPKDVRLWLRYPPGLYTDLTAKVRCTAFRAAADCAGAIDAKVQIEERRADETEYSIRWR